MRKFRHHQIQLRSLALPRRRSLLAEGHTEKTLADDYEYIHAWKAFTRYQKTVPKTVTAIHLY
jgi:hypothetical protein